MEGVGGGWRESEGSLEGYGRDLEGGRRRWEGRKRLGGESVEGRRRVGGVLEGFGGGLEGVGEGWRAGRGLEGGVEEVEKEGSGGVWRGRGVALPVGCRGRTGVLPDWNLQSPGGYQDVARLHRGPRSRGRDPGQTVPGR